MLNLREVIFLCLLIFCHHGNGFSCEDCNRTYSTYRRFEEHSCKRKTNRKRCMYCTDENSPLMTTTEMTQHVRKVHKYPICSDCGCTADDKKQFEACILNQIVTCTPDKIHKSIYCNHCGRYIWIRPQNSFQKHKNQCFRYRPLSIAFVDNPRAEVGTSDATHSAASHATSHASHASEQY